MDLSIVSFALIGTLYGLFIGIIPSSGSNKALILLFSIATYFWGMPYEFVAFSMAAAISCTIGDSFAGVYIGVPGANSAAATMVEGFPMTKEGRSSYAIALAITTSGLQGLIWVIPVMIILPIYLNYVHLLMIPEIWCIIIFSFLTVSLLTSSFIKGIIAVAIGVGLGTIGSDVVGNPRFTFGHDDYFYDGISVVILATGFFCIPELWSLWKTDIKYKKHVSNFTQIKEGVRDAFRLWRHSFLGGAIGFFYGCLPGYGGMGSEWLAYGIGTKLKRKFDIPFGKGAPEGLVAPEGVNNAGKAGALLPTLLLGIPGSTWTMIIMGLWQFVGFPIGESYLLEDQKFINTVFGSYMFALIFTVMLSLCLAGPLSHILRINKHVFIVTIICVTWWACISTNFYSSILEDTLLFLLFSAVGFACKHYRISRPAILLGFILSSKVEEYSYTLYDMYDFEQVITRPFVIVVIGLAILMVLFSRKIKVDYV